jgi:nucleotide-binding universal stress UspA family protein
MSGTVVVGVDGSEASKAAVGWAARQAEFLGATLVAVNS